MQHTTRFLPSDVVTEVRGRRPGDEKAGRITRTAEPPTCETHDPTEGFHVTLDGTPEGDGSLDAPWDLQAALRRAPREDPNPVSPIATWNKDTLRG